MQAIHEKLRKIYGNQEGTRLFADVVELVEKYPPLEPKDWVSEKDSILITYADQFSTEGKSPLQSLEAFARKYLQDLVSTIHILPFYPYSSDDGFSVIDYWAVNPQVGTWDDIKSLGESFDLMFDAVINHISAQSDWFQEYLAGNPEYRDFFIEADPNEDYSLVTRPRALPLLTEFETSRGKRHLWTTFSEDQIDLNFRSSRLFLKILELLLFYVSEGARFIRLDAVGFLWKELGTRCIHLPETHLVIRAYREILDRAAPGTILITETNVPHKDNISYFGNGFDEAHLVYQFPLPPLTLFSFITGDATKLSRWLAELETPSDQTTFFNFLASHDGIGVTPAHGILDKDEIDTIVRTIKERNGYISYRDNGDGTKSVYELNISLVDALSDPHDGQDKTVARFIASQGLLLSLQGVPGIYVHSLLGSRGWHQGVLDSGIKRRVNREKFETVKLETELQDGSSMRHSIFKQYAHLLRIRKEQEAFHPNSPQRVLELKPDVLSIVRGSGQDQVLCLINVSDNSHTIHMKDALPDLQGPLLDLISGEAINDVTQIAPYQVLWVKRAV